MHGVRAAKLGNCGTVATLAELAKVIVMGASVLPLSIPGIDDVHLTSLHPQQLDAPIIRQVGELSLVHQIGLQDGAVAG